jgi:hypothetical protein
LTVEAEAPAPADPICRVCGGGRWTLVLGRLGPASTSEVAK